MTAFLDSLGIQTENAGAYAGSWLDTSGFNRFPKRFLAFAKEELYTVLTE